MMFNMKKLGLVVGLLLGSTIVFAQRVLNDVTLRYKIAVDAKNDNAKALNGATMVVYLKSNQSKSVMESSMGTETNVYDNKVGKGFILKSYSGQKLMITLNKDNWKEKNRIYPSLKFDIASTEEKFGQYSLKKATASLPGGRTYTVFFTPDLVPANKDYNNAFPQLPGIPVKYSIVSGDIVFTYTLENIEMEYIQGNIFEAPKSGFRVMTYEENMQLKKEANPKK